MRRLALLVLVALAFTSCRGPKGSPSGSVKSFYACIDAKDWSTLVEIIDTRSRTRLGPQAAAKLAYQFDEWRDVDITIEEEFVDSAETTATVKVTCTAKQFANHKVEEFGCNETLALDKEDDGKWHVSLPGGGRLSPM